MSQRARVPPDMLARGFILQPTYRTRDERPVIQLFGRLEDGRAFCVEDDRFHPYLFVPDDDARRAADVTGLQCDQTEYRDLSGWRVAKSVARHPSEVPRLRDRLDEIGTRSLEADIRFAYRYLIDCGVRASVEIDGQATAVRLGFVRFLNPVLPVPAGKF